jgi:hypothetical protein
VAKRLASEEMEAARRGRRRRCACLMSGRSVLLRRSMSA